MKIVIIKKSIPSPHQPASFFYGEIKDRILVFHVWLSPNQGQAFHRQIIKPLKVRHNVPDGEDKSTKREQ